MGKGGAESALPTIGGFLKKNQGTPGACNTVYNFRFSVILTQKNTLIFEKTHEKFNRFFRQILENHFIVKQ